MSLLLSQLGLNLEQAVSIEEGVAGAGVAIVMPDGRRYNTTLPMTDLVAWLNKPFLYGGNCIGVIDEYTRPDL